MTNNILQKIDEYLELYIKTAYIRNIGKNKWRVFSEKGKNLGTYNSESAAKKRLKQIEYFKHVKASLVIDLTSLKELTYSAVMRELRKTKNEEVVKEFLTIFKKIFDELVINEQKDPADKAMPAALILLSKKYDVRCQDD